MSEMLAHLDAGGHGGGRVGRHIHGLGLQALRLGHARAVWGRAAQRTVQLLQRAPAPTEPPHTSHTDQNALHSRAHMICTANIPITIRLR